MPRRSYRKKSYRKRRPRSSWGGYLNTASKALAVAYGVKKLINVERKFHITAATHAPNSSTWNLSLLSGVAQGDTAQTRDGNKFKAIGLSIKGQIFIDSAASATAVRCMLVKVKSLQGAAPSTTDILQSNNYLSSYNNVNCPYRFQILWDRTFSVSTDRPTLHFSKFIKQQTHSTFSGATAAVTDCQEGHYYFITMTNESTNTPDIVFNHRLTFVDN